MTSPDVSVGELCSGLLSSTGDRVAAVNLMTAEA